jgi:hypothetical protein
VTTRPASGLLDLFQQIPDPRGRQGLRHSLPAMLATVVCAVMSGFSSYAAIEQWIHAQQAAFWHLLGFTRRPPKQDGFRKFLNKLNPQDVERVLQQWLAQLGVDLPNEATLPPCTLDGKVLRGTRGKWERAWQVITLLDNHTGRICSQAAVAAETNEQKAAVELLKSMVVQGKLVVADAAYCHREFCEAVLEQQGEYLVLVKDNQPTLQHQVEQAFVIPKAFSPLPSEIGGSGASNRHHDGEKSRPH